MTVTYIDAPRPDGRFFRGLLFALPVSLGLWALLITAALFAVQ